MVEQKINTRKTDEGYYVEVLNDGKLAWTDTFETEERLNWFIKCCDLAKKSGGGDSCLSQEEARERLESGKFGVDIFYRHPLGYRITFICNLDAAPEHNEHGFHVFFIDKHHDADSRIVPTIDEVFRIIKDVEDGKV